MRVKKVEQNITQTEGAAASRCRYSRLQVAHLPCREINNVPKQCLKRQEYGQVGSNGFNFQEQIHNSFLAPVNTNGSDFCIIQRAKVDLR
jgi:hypothetical protein